jgi:hypothetical protein
MVQDKFDGLDLSFDDDGWFAVPDTACSNAKAHTGAKLTKSKDFEYEDVRFPFERWLATALGGHGIASSFTHLLDLSTLATYSAPYSFCPT